MAGAGSVWRVVRPCPDPLREIILYRYNVKYKPERLY
jgi:hypothetical protein